MSLLEEKKWPDTHCPECGADRGDPCKTKHDEKASQSHKNRRTQKDRLGEFGLHEASIYDPPDDRIIDDGEYITIIRPPTVNDFEWLEMGMTFWANHGNTRNEKGFLPDGKYKIVAHTHKGDVHLFPYEYCVLGTDTIKELYSNDELQFHANQIDEDDLTEQVHYMKSRGIPETKALAMAVGSMDQNIGWYEPVLTLQAMLKLQFGN